MEPFDLDPFSPDALEDPYDLYAELRTRSPVHHIAHMGLHLVTRYHDVRDAANRKEDFSSNLTALVVADGRDADSRQAQLVDFSSADAADVLATADPPNHAGQRKVVARTFREIDSARPRLDAMVDEMLGPLLDGGSAEFMSDFALWLPVQVMADLLGLPAADVPMIKRGSDSAVEMLSGVTPPERIAGCVSDVAELHEYIIDQLARADGGPAGGLLSTMAAAVRAGEVTSAEAAGMALQLVVAGSDSTGNLMGSAVRLLSEREQVQAALRDDPGLVPDYLEEVLRLESPFRGHFRVAVRDTAIGGAEIAEGERLFLMWGAANRDPEVFEDPEELVIGRPNARDHVGFGWGIHRCVGAPLARLESRLAIGELLRRTTDIVPTPRAPTPAHTPSMLVRRLSHVHLDLVGR